MGRIKYLPEDPPICPRCKKPWKRIHYWECLCNRGGQTGCYHESGDKDTPRMQKWRRKFEEINHDYLVEWDEDGWTYLENENRNFQRSASEKF